MSITPGLTYVSVPILESGLVPLETTTNVDGTATVSYSNNVGFYHFALPVLPAPDGPAPSPNTIGLAAAANNPNGVSAPSPNTIGLPAAADNPQDISLKSVSAAKQRLQAGKLDEITAVLRAGSEGTRRLKVYFYDGDPDKGGKLIGIEPAWFQPRSITKVRLPYHPASDGVYQIWAVINKGRPYQTERHTAAIVVGKAKADPNNSGGDLPPKDKEGNNADKN